MNPESRKQILKKKGKCFLCLRSGHLSRSCQSSVKCFKCQGAHHVSICNNSEQTQKNHEKPGNAASGSTSLYVDQSKRSVFLQTAAAEVVRPDDERYCKHVRLVLDSCSQRSYITEELKNQLGLPVIGKDSLLIKTFGESDARLRLCEIVQVGIKTASGETVYIQTYVVPVICGPLTQQPTESPQYNYHYLQELPLVDRNYTRNLTVSILIGADHYWTLVEGTVIKGGPCEPVALATKLGYVLSGRTTVMVNDESSNSVNLTATHVLKVETNVVKSDKLASEVRRFWDYESLGILDENLPLYDKFLYEVEFVKGRYQVRYPSRSTTIYCQIILL